MPTYRTNDGQGWMHMLIRGRGAPAQCVAPAFETDNLALGPRCGRMSVVVCDFPVGQTLGGNPLTCDAPICEKHRTKVGPNIDHCPRHAARQQPSEVPNAAL